MRIGWDEDHLNGVECAKAAEAAGVSAIAVHGRTRVQFYEGRADWGRIGEIKAAVRIPVIGNGDIFSLADAQKMLAETGVDGIMIARAACGNPWIFEQCRAALSGQPIPEKPSIAEVSEMALRHATMAMERYGEHRAVPIMRSHVSWYYSGFPNSAAMRKQVNTVTTFEQLRELLEKNL